MFLDKIIAHKRVEIEEQKKLMPLDRMEISYARRDFKQAISTPGKVNLIAEIKKASPSRGIIRSDFDPVDIAKIYESNGASAISVLTDREFFQGDLSFLKIVRSATLSLPILRKDFIIDEYQIYQSAMAGADAILLIAALLDLKTIERFQKIANELCLDCLLEVHTEDELDKAFFPIIGINNRDLKTFKTDIQTTAKLIKLMPEDKVVVSESGISTRDDVEFLKECGVKAMLVGESLMSSDNIATKIKQLLQ